ncbi:MAG: hypothetical protein Q9182_006424 [Xanthomendoza sp. 2 TL-2023]
MPVYRNITINLVSQFDILNIPEYAPPSTSDDPFSTSAALVDNSIVCCYVPTYPLSQFWFSYTISAPHPPKAWYYFKLFINGSSIVSWGCGERNDFKGSTMYGLFDSGDRWRGVPDVAARAFTFASDSTTQQARNNTLGQVMEIRVYRARGRKRIKPNLEHFSAVVGRSGIQAPSLQSKNSKSQAQNIKSGVHMSDAGLLPDDHPCRYYTYLLLDPLDTPYATFRWYYRTWTQLEMLGVTKPLGSRPTTDSNPQTSVDVEKESSRPPAKITSNPSTPPDTKIGPMGSPISESDISPLVIRGLSLPDIPPLNPPTSQGPFGGLLKRTGSPIPALSSGTASTPGRFAQLVRRTSRSPSPTKTERDKRPSSPTRLRRTTSLGTLMDAVQSAMRRNYKPQNESGSSDLQVEGGQVGLDSHTNSESSRSKPGGKQKAKGVDSDA